MNKATILISVTLLLVGIVIGVLLTNVFYVKKWVNVKIDNGIATFESNVNRDGDTYSIVIGKDTVNKGVVINGEWK